MKNNIDHNTVHSFGDEWARFDQTGLSTEEAEKIFKEYFKIFPWSKIHENAEGFDMGCGTGRWAQFVAPHVGVLHCIDPSGAINIASRNLSKLPNVVFHKSAVGDNVLKPSSQDFGYSLGVLHHVPDTSAAIKSCVELLKPGAPLLVYLYYAFDGRPVWFRIIWKISDLLRRIIFRCHPTIKNFITDLIACMIYLPLARLSGCMVKYGVNIDNFPLSYYRSHSFYTMRTDARDRFGTPLENRFSREQINEMMRNSGLVDIEFSDSSPYWCVVGYRKNL